jgi:hypothetical protein
MIENIEKTVNQYVDKHMTQVKPATLGLDPRCGYRLHVNEESIAISKSYDRSLQYYGGFEYVSSAYRVEMGDYVFYLNDGDRVSDHIANFTVEA